MTPAESPSRPARRRPKNDPLRRQRIIDATARIIGTQGIGAVTFRSVAAEADVPLGSTTYYFADKDELLVSTILELRQKSDIHFASVLADRIPKYGVAGGIARMVEEVTTDWHDSLLEGYGVYVSTFSQQSLRSVVSSWTLEHLMSMYCPPASARPVAFLLEGVLAQVVLGQASVTAEELEPAIQKLLELE
ncbi:TetR/AcrR family transcriptional regulator [Leucobacter sp.]